MHRSIAALVVLTFLASASAALGAGPSYVMLGGSGVLAPDGKTRYIAVATENSTAIERVRVGSGAVVTWADLSGTWGIPAPTSAATGGEGLTRDGKRLIVGTVGAGNPSRFAVIGTRFMRVLDRFSLNGSYAYDALSPDGSMLYLVQHVDQNNVNRYVVRAYDLTNHRLLPGRIADKTQAGWVMDGWALTRATSGDGRWVYTLYQRPGGYPFIHALDTVNGVAHCTGLPWKGDQSVLSNIRLTLGDNGRTLAVHWKSGRPWLAMNTASWRLTHVHASAFPWRWVVVASGGALAVVLAIGVVLLGRRRQPREAAPVAL